MTTEAGQRVANFAGRSGLVVATRIAVLDTLVSWDDHGRDWVSSLALDIQTSDARPDAGEPRDESRTP